jgi:hypothetical protein
MVGPLFVLSFFPGLYGAVEKKIRAKGQAFKGFWLRRK